MKRIANKDAYLHVSNFVVFVGNNTYSQHKCGCYIVYSYGEHYPMYIYKDKTWYENKDKYSRTTSKHHSQLRPRHVTVFELRTTEEMENIINPRETR